MELKKLLYAVDLEDAPHPAIEHVKMVASLTGASVSIVYVLPSETVYESNYLSGEGQPNRIAPTQALLEKMEHFLNTNFPEGVDDCAFLMGKISEEVVKYAHKSDIDCIVVGAHGRIGFRQLFAGSVATEVVKKALSRQARKSITRFGTSRLAGGFFMRKSVPRIRPAAALARMG